MFFSDKPFKTAVQGTKTEKQDKRVLARGKGKNNVASMRRKAYPGWRRIRVKCALLLVLKSIK